MQIKDFSIFTMVMVIIIIGCGEYVGKYEMSINEQDQNFVKVFLASSNQELYS